MFDEAWYLGRYPDVANAVRAGHFRDGREHYERHGKGEGREPVPPAPITPLPTPTPVTPAGTPFVLGNNAIRDSSTVFAVRSDHTDNAVANQAYHQATFTFTSTGRGATVNGGSQSWWGGVTSIFKKGGSGSAHGFTCSVWLEGTLGYAEAGGFQGQVENRSAHGNFLSMFEGIIKDNGYSTNMTGLVVRMLKDNPTAALPSQGILVTGEGAGTCDAILTTPVRNAQFHNRFRTGIDLAKAQFTSGYGILLPANTAIGWTNITGTEVPVLRLTSDGSTWLRIENLLRHVTVGPPDSGGPGKRILTVEN